MVRITTSIVQKRMVVSYLEDYPKLVRKQYSKEVATLFWQDLTRSINRYGPARSTKAWRKLWSAWKSAAFKRQRLVENGERVGLSELDQRIVRLFREDHLPLQNVQMHLQYMPALPLPADYGRIQDVVQIEPWEEPLEPYFVSAYSGEEYFIITDY